MYSKEDKPRDQKHARLQTAPPSRRNGHLSPALRRQQHGLKINQHAPSLGLWSDLKTLRWMVNLGSAFKLLLIPIAAWATWELLGSYISPAATNPFAPCLFISNPVSSTTPEDPRYAKSYLDLVFIGYHIIFFSFVRIFATQTVYEPLGRYFRITNEAKLERFGEVGYGIFYYFVMGVCGTRVMTQLPTWWLRTEYMWIDYPHWQMTPGMKRYYLMHTSYWVQQLLVLVLGLEKPRKDHKELIVHHLVTLWMVGWGYLMNLTYIGNMMFVSMDFPDAALNLAKFLNYIQWEKAKTAAFICFVPIWGYFRHWTSIRILYSVWNDYEPLIPEWAHAWKPSEGVWMLWWIKHQIFFALGVLQCLNIYWGLLILRILVRTIVSHETEDVRSDDEDEEEAEVYNSSQKLD